tara:strand:- start:16466 stop:17347 length:882 start_codon:yes stop_codon:yes gene_type:complete
MKFTLPYLINLPPFMFRGIDFEKLNLLQKILFILKGKLLGFLINKLQGKNFCNAVNFFYRENTKIYYEDNLYKKEIKNTGVICYPNKRILRMVNNYDLQLKILLQSYCLDDLQIEKDSIVIDCGANVGELNIAFMNLGIKVNYVGFEPDPETFECLRLNNLNESNKLFMKALSNQNSKDLFYIDDYGGNSSLVKFDNSKPIEVTTVTLDSLKLNKKIKLFKVEAEGFEPEIIEGSLNTLKHIEFVSVDYGYERGEKEESTIVKVNDMLYENNFKLIKFSEFRLIGLYENQSYK